MMMDRPPNARTVQALDDRVCGLTDIGLRRRRNEDAFLLRTDLGLLVVADGLGGLPAGDVASRTAVERVAAELEAGHGEREGRTGGAEAREDHARWAMLDAFLEAHIEIARRGIGDPDLRGMATTLVAALVWGDHAYLSHVGDVRGYVAREGRLFQLTSDHSLVGEMVAAGRLSAEEARVHPRKNVVTQVLGLEDAPAPSFTSVALSRGDLLMLCSDGLWESMPAEELERLTVTAQGSGGGRVESAVVALADAALAVGGHDNITAVLYRHEP